MPHPQKIETVHVEKLDNELCLYDWQRLEVHNLNPTAAKVWQLCDGQTSPQQMAGQLKGDLTPAQAEELVWLTLARLEKAHLLEKAVVKPAGRKVYTRREMLVRLGVAAALLPVISSIVAPGPVEAQSPQPPQPPTGGSQTFNFTGAEQQFTVPAGVTSVTIEAFGAQGGTGEFAVVSGGNGGSVRATISVTPGETLFVYVGGQGGTGGSGGLGNGGSGGFNGGGAGGFGANGGGGGGGGGGSDVRQGGNGLANRTVVAGGGGGSGGRGGGGGGGTGGSTTGGTGGDGTGSATGGGGGTQASGGTGGTGGNGGTNGNNGATGIGGDGGGNNPPNNGGGGGGGAGYFGGGGGSMIFGSAAGGGGGSSFPSSATHNQGVRSGDGQVIISW
jgi:hypothetical protein